MTWPCVKGTIILKAGNPQEEDGALDYAAGILKNGGVVAFPTETVYGLNNARSASCGEDLQG